MGLIISGKAAEDYLREVYYDSLEEAAAPARTFADACLPGVKERRAVSFRKYGKGKEGKWVFEENEVVLVRFDVVEKMVEEEA
jgi:hypothetical protein